MKPASLREVAAVATASRRRPEASAIDRLLQEPQRFEFHQAVRLLRRWSERMPAAQRPDLRFRNTLSLSFPASQIRAIDVHRGRAPATADPDQIAAADAIERLELTPAFMGLLGTGGALPLVYSEQFAGRESIGRDGAARAFLDIFQHRAVSLFHDAWRKHRLPLQFESDRRERYLPLVLSLVGLGEPALRDRLRARDGGVADDALAFYAGLLQRRAVSADHLQRVLADYFGVGVRVTQFVGRWLALDDDCQATLGGSSARLGRDTVIGPRMWQRDLRVRISVGPLDRVQHQRFLPGGPAALALRELLTLVSGVSLEYEVHLRLRAACVVTAQLPGAPRDVRDGARLGWDSFLTSKPAAKDHEAVAYHLHALTH